MMLPAGIPTVADVSVVTGVTAVACNLANTVEVLCCCCPPCFKKLFASVGVSIVPIFHGVLVAAFAGVPVGAGALRP
jgi:hypothetical protein